MLKPKCLVQYKNKYYCGKIIDNWIIFIKNIINTRHRQTKIHYT